MRTGLDISEAANGGLGNDSRGYTSLEESLTTTGLQNAGSFFRTPVHAAEPTASGSPSTALRRNLPWLGERGLFNADRATSIKAGRRAKMRDPSAGS